MQTRHLIDRGTVLAPLLTSPHRAGRDLRGLAAHGPFGRVPRGHAEADRLPGHDAGRVTLAGQGYEFPLVESVETPYAPACGVSSAPP